MFHTFYKIQNRYKPKTHFSFLFIYLYTKWFMKPWTHGRILICYGFWYPMFSIAPTVLNKRFFNNISTKDRCNVSLRRFTIDFTLMSLCELFNRDRLSNISRSIIFLVSFCLKGCVSIFMVGQNLVGCLAVEMYWGSLPLTFDSYSYSSSLFE